MASPTVALRRPLCSPCHLTLRHHTRHLSTAERPTWGNSAGTIMRQSCPQKIIHDHLIPMPSHQLATLLSDLMPATGKRFPSSPTVQPVPIVLPPGAHLVYFPPQMPASELAPDGADADHVPPGFRLATPEDERVEGKPRGGRRLWVGGELTFRKGWRNRLRLDGRAALCVEKIGNVDVRDDGRKTFVDIGRSYGLSANVAEIHERRTLCFVNDGADQGDDLPTSPKSIKFPHEPTASYTFTITPTHLFQFSALTYNAHFIHLDRQKALVHGPLTLALMLRALNFHRGATVKHMTYRNIAPLRVGQQTRVCVRAPAELGVKPEMWDVWVEGPDGGMIAKGRAQMYE